MLEYLKVELARLDSQKVTRRGRDKTLHAGGAQRLAEARDLHSQGVIRRPRLPVSEQLFDQAVPRNDVVRRQEEKSEERSLPWTADLQWSVVETDLERAQDPELNAVAAHGPEPKCPAKARVSQAPNAN